MLAAHRTAVAREKARTDDEDEETILAAINAKLAAMRARERAIVLLLADGRGADEPDDD